MIAHSKLNGTWRINAIVSYPSGWDGGTKMCLSFHLIVGWVCSVLIPDLTNMILSYAPFAVCVILHLLSTFTSNVTKRSAAKALDSLFYGSTQYRLVWPMCLELNDCQLDIYRERCQLHWGRWYEFWPPRQNLLFSCVGFEESVTFFGWFFFYSQ